MSQRSNIRSGEKTIRGELKAQFKILAAFIAAFWLIEIVDLVVFQGGLDRFGIRPRSTSGLVGIALSPFLHVGFGHLVMNTIPFLVLGWVIMLRETWHFWVVTPFVAIVGGGGVWLIGQSSSVHVGASGVIFGFFGFLLLRGWFERTAGSIIVSVLVFLTYGGMIWGVLPGQPGLSWEGHLCGFGAGVLAAWIFARGLRLRGKRGAAA